MKTLLFLLCAISFGVSTGRGQILNAGFESWTAGEPDNWTTSNAAPLLVNVKSSTDAHSGSFSLRAEVDTFSNSVFAPVLQNHYVGHRGSGVDHRIGALTGWIKFHSDSGDALQISLLAGKGDSSIGAGSMLTASDVTAWDQFSIPVTYYLPYAIPDTVIILCTIKGYQGASPHLGSWFELDDLAFADPVDAVEVGSTGRLDVAIFPNPIASDGQIQLRLPQPGWVHAELFDAVGRSVRSVAAGSISATSSMIPLRASGLADGIYYLKLQASGQTLTRSVIIRH